MSAACAIPAGRLRVWRSVRLLLGWSSRHRGGAVGDVLVKRGGGANCFMPVASNGAVEDDDNAAA